MFQCSLPLEMKQISQERMSKRFGMLKKVSSKLLIFTLCKGNPERQKLAFGGIGKGHNGMYFKILHKVVEYLSCLLRPFCFSTSQFTWEAK